MSRVMIHPSDYQSCRESVDRAFELFPLPLAGKKVLVKPNVLRASEAREAIVTHPSVLRAVVERIEEAGPASTDLRDIGLILASDNAVAMDSVVARMMGLDPGRLRFLRKAKERGLGDYEPESIEVLGELKVLPDFKLPPLGGEALTGNQTIQEMLDGRTRLRPKADSERCTACGTCIEQCPVSALSVNGDLPEVDADTCITCFCCQEICPEQAIALQ